MTIEHQRKDERLEGAPVRAELTRVSLRNDQFTHEGHRVPAGAQGTIVDVLAGGRAYIVEFARPFAALVTVEAPDMANVDAQ